MGRIHRAPASDLRTAFQSNGAAFGTAWGHLWKIVLALAVDDNAGERSIKARVYNGGTRLLQRMH
jgi:hypothetical protein